MAREQSTHHGRCPRRGGRRAAAAAPAGRWIALVLGLLPAACTLPMMEVGNAPVGPVREVETEEDRRRRARSEEARHAAADAADAANAAAEEPASQGGESPAARVRTGVATSRRFHKAGCAELAQAPTAEQVTFVSAFDALDQGYAPCPSCRPYP